MATMTGVVFLGNRRLELREFPIPEPGYGQVLIRMKASSLCGSDLRAIYRTSNWGRVPKRTVALLVAMSHAVLSSVSVQACDAFKRVRE